jgi:transposase-like protein
MSKRGPYRQHSVKFKLQLCQRMRFGGLGRCDTQQKYSLSANLIQLWLTRFDRGELVGEEVEAATTVGYKAKIAALATNKGPRALLGRQ